MNNKEKLYLVKVARVANTPEQMQSYQRLGGPIGPTQPWAPSSRFQNALDSTLGRYRQQWNDTLGKPPRKNPFTQPVKRPTFLPRG